MIIDSNRQINICPVYFVIDKVNKVYIVTPALKQPLHRPYSAFIQPFSTFGSDFYLIILPRIASLRFLKDEVLLPS